MNFDLAVSLPILERTPSVLRALLGNLSPVWTDATEGGESWSPYVVLGHLIHGDRADWIVRAKIILAQGEQRRFVPFDRLAQFRESEGKSLHQLLDEFAEIRATNLKILTDWQLTNDQLELTGEHPAFGTVHLRQLLACWVTHDLSHIAQCTRVMAKQYREAVGPWAEYLPILNK